MGGTVGDIENELYIEAVRQLKKEVGAHNICYVHLTYIPIPYGVNEQKSKPHSKVLINFNNEVFNQTLLLEDAVNI